MFCGANTIPIAAGWAELANTSLGMPATEVSSLRLKKSKRRYRKSSRRVTSVEKLSG